MNIAIITAGGAGTRMHSKDRPKQFLVIHGKPIIIHTLRHFDEHPEIDGIIIACIENWIPYLHKLTTEYHIKKIIDIVSGGATGQLSIYNGLCAAELYAKEEDAIVLVHDSVRPLINKQTITDNIESVRKYGTAITTAKVQETVVEVDESGIVKQVPDRKKSHHARAPQSFWLSDIISVQRNAMKEGKTSFVDSCSLMSYYGKTLHCVNGPGENIKVTNPNDFYSLRAILTAKEDSQIYGYDEK